jgi:hypothetical protein
VNAHVPTWPVRGFSKRLEPLERGRQPKQPVVLVLVSIEKPLQQTRQDGEPSEWESVPVGGGQGGRPPIGQHLLPRTDGLLRSGSRDERYHEREHLARIVGNAVDFWYRNSWERAPVNWHRGNRRNASGAQLSRSLKAFKYLGLSISNLAHVDWPPVRHFLFSEMSDYIEASNRHQELHECESRKLIGVVFVKIACGIY